MRTGKEVRAERTRHISEGKDKTGSEWETRREAGEGKVEERGP